MNRFEFLHLYESVFANANGDPLNDNRPRIDQETGLQFVTMYRIKRTVRDFLKLKSILEPVQGGNILLAQERYAEGDKEYLKTMEMILREKTDLTTEDICNKFIDIRMFGGLFAIKGTNLSLQGPIQVSYGKSLHKVVEQEVQLSAMMPSGPKKEQGTLGTAFVVPYALIGVDGTINQFNAEKSFLTESDVYNFFDSLWTGTGQLKTTSKNQKSLLMVSVEFKEEHPYAQIGNFKDYLSVSSEKEDLEIRSMKDYTVNLNDFVLKLNAISHKIKKVIIVRDSNLKFSHNEIEVDSISAVLPSGFEIEERIL